MLTYTSQLEQLQQAHLLRRLRVIPDGTIDLANNDYLALSKDARVIDAAMVALKNHGAGARASRLVSGNLSIHQKLEETIAAFKHTESALVFPTGYQANLSTITALAQAGDYVFCDKRNHASLIDACRLAQTHGANVRYFGNHQKLQTLLKSTFEKDFQKRRFIVSDGVFSMDGDVANVPGLLDLAKRYDAALLLDDAHGTGTLGPNGHGTAEHFGLKDTSHLVHIGTLSKAIGAQGGFVAADKSIIDWILNTARPFIYTTALAPAACGAALAAFELIESSPHLPQQLRALTKEIGERLQQLGFEATVQPSPIIAVLVGDAQKAVQLSARLLEEGIWCPAIRPPTVPRGKSRLRVAVNLSLSKDDVRKVLLAFEKYQNLG